MTIVPKVGYLSLEYANGTFEFGKKAIIEGRITLANTDRARQLQARYGSFFESFLKRPSSPQVLQEEMERFEKMELKKGVDLTVITLSDKQKNLLKVFYCVEDVLLDPKKLPRFQLKIEKETINGRPIEECAWLVE